PLIPKKVAIWRICPVPTKSPGLLQNFSIPGSNSRQLIRLGILSPRPQSPDCCCCTQNSQISISHSLTAELFFISRRGPLLRERLRARSDGGKCSIAASCGGLRIGLSLSGFQAAGFLVLVFLAPGLFSLAFLNSWSRFFRHQVSLSEVRRTTSFRVAGTPARLEAESALRRLVIPVKLKWLERYSRRHAGEPGGYHFNQDAS